MCALALQVELSVPDGGGVLYDGSIHSQNLFLNHCQLRKRVLIRVASRHDDFQSIGNIRHLASPYAPTVQLSAPDNHLTMFLPCASSKQPSHRRKLFLLQASLWTHILFW